MYRTLNILKASQNNSIKIVYAASASCYGIPKNFLPLEIL